MAERLIPIDIEGREEQKVNSENDNEQSQLSKSLEELSVHNKTEASTQSSSLSDSQSSAEPSKVKVQIKPATTVTSNCEQEFFQRYNLFEKRNEDLLSKYNLPNCDVVEKIVLVIDRAQEDNYTPFLIGNQKYTPLSIVKRSVSIFIKLKLGINPNHQFSIIAMSENKASLLINFTNDCKKLMECLNKISECEAEDIFNLNTIFDIICEETLPSALGPGFPPPYMLRMIIFYGRSYTIPKVVLTEEVKAILNNPFFVCDILMTHEPVEMSNYCQKIFDILQNLDQKGMSYFFPVGRDLRRMHKCSGILLGHSLQRPIQKLLKN